jgi:hypothetical protein
MSDKSIKTMDFFTALKNLTSGLSVGRSAYPDRFMSYRINFPQKDEPIQIGPCSHIMLSTLIPDTSEYKHEKYRFTEEDQLATDWVVL